MATELQNVKERWGVSSSDTHPTPVELKLFSLSDYLKTAIACAEYQLEDGAITASVPGVIGFYSEGDTQEEARANLLDAVEGNILIALQMGWDIPQLPGVEIKTETVSFDSP